MEIQLERQDATNATIKVNLTESDYKPKVSEKLKEYSKKAQLKGFRPGKVPSSLIEKMYGKSILVDEINNLLGDSLNKYIKDNNLPIIGDPLPNTSGEVIDWDNQKNFSFDYNIGLVPEFNYELNGNLPLKRYEIETNDKVVQETLQNLLSQFGNSEEVEQVESGDLIEGALETAGGTKNATIYLAKVKENQVGQFTGKSKQDQLTIDLHDLFEEKAALAQLLGITAKEAEELHQSAIFTIEKIKRNQNATLDQVFFDKIFGPATVTTEQEFMTKLEETIKQNYQREAEQLLKRDSQEALLQSVNFDLPNEFLKRWLLVTNEGKVTKEQIDNEYEFYLRELKWTLIKNKIAKDNSIHIEEADIKQRAKDMVLQQFGSMNFEPEMDDTFNKIADNYLKQEKGKNYMKIYDDLMLERLMDLIIDKVQPEKKSISVEEFKALD